MLETIIFDNKGYKVIRVEEPQTGYSVFKFTVYQDNNWIADFDSLINAFEFVNYKLATVKTIAS